MCSIAVQVGDLVLSERPRVHGGLEKIHPKSRPNNVVIVIVGTKDYPRLVRPADGEGNEGWDRHAVPNTIDVRGQYRACFATIVLVGQDQVRGRLISSPRNDWWAQKVGASSSVGVQKAPLPRARNAKVNFVYVLLGVSPPVRLVHVFRPGLYLHEGACDWWRPTREVHPGFNAHLGKSALDRSCVYRPAGDITVETQGAIGYISRPARRAVGVPDLIPHTIFASISKAPQCNDP